MSAIRKTVMLLSAVLVLGASLSAVALVIHEASTVASVEDLLTQELAAALATANTASSRATNELTRSPSLEAQIAPAFTGPAQCIPTCSTADGRFLAIAGANLGTLSGADIRVQLAVPASETGFDLSVFDGDSGGTDTAGEPHWDLGTPAPYTYTLFADPLADGTGTFVVSSFSSTSLADNAWSDFNFTNVPEAVSPGGNYFYSLVISLDTPTLTALNAFKVRTSGVVTIELFNQPFAFIANLVSFGDALTIYPDFPNTTPTTYDGTFRFFLDVPVSETNLIMWDGDLDHGSYDGTEQDTDDPNTENAPFLPPWSVPGTNSEGVAIGLNGLTGAPPDDFDPNDPSGVGPFLLRTPSVRYDVIAPDGTVYPNDNPSGNLEWEQFRISTDTADPTEVDATATALPAGTYEVRISGVDMQNLNAWFFFKSVLCVDEQDVPCEPLRPFVIGDLVWFDADGDGLQGAGEPGIEGVLVEVLDTNGAVVGTTTTAADGSYSFPATREEYTVRIASSNFAAGGPLEGMASTNGGDSQTDTVLDDNVLTYDFGYRGSGSLGDRVWEDVDADGVQDAGEAGLNGVLVILLDSEGETVASQLTAGDGDYLFSNLLGGDYSVVIDSLTLPAGAVQTFDADGTATSNTAVVTLPAGAADLGVDFGYQVLSEPPGTGTPGYWKNHAEAWPVAEITMGGVLYSRDDAIAVMNTPPKGDKTYNMFSHLVASKLNVLIGNDASCISVTITDSEAWLTANPLGSKVKANSSAWQSSGSALYGVLVAYNEGQLCGPPRG